MVNPDLGLHNLEKYDVIDPATGEPAERNVFWPSRFGPDAPTDAAAKDNVYQDAGIEALQKRAPSSSPDTRPLMATPIRRWRTVGFLPIWIRRRWSPISRRISFRMRC